ncbi:rRNA maturation RNase YbeY [Candidatus Margulisiibacteriota bacterium]
MLELYNFQGLISKILKAEGEEGIINLLFVGDKEIKKLNSEFRKKNKPTDVLAFPMGEEGILGDIAISTETAIKNAKTFGVSSQAELKRLVVHGVLHLIGYRHGKEMGNAEEIYQKF